MGLRPEDLRRLGITPPEVRLPPALAAVLGESAGEGVQAPPGALQPDPRRQEAGRRARAQGERPELALEVLHARYFAERRADIHRIEVPIKRTGKAGPGEFTAVYRRDANVDFAGWALIGDALLPVALELKTASVDRIALDAVEPHQAEHLEALELAGGLALVLVGLPAGWWAVRWRAWRAPRDTPERKSLNTCHFEASGVPVPAVAVQLSSGRTAVAPDWMATIDGVLSPTALPKPRQAHRVCAGA